MDSTWEQTSHRTELKPTVRFCIEPSHYMEIIQSPTERDKQIEVYVEKCMSLRWQVLNTSYFPAVFLTAGLTVIRDVMTIKQYWTYVPFNHGLSKLRSES